MLASTWDCRHRRHCCFGRDSQMITVRVRRIDRSRMTVLPRSGLQNALEKMTLDGKRSRGSKSGEIAELCCAGRTHWLRDWPPRIAGKPLMRMQHEPHETV